MNKNKLLLLALCLALVGCNNANNDSSTNSQTSSSSSSSLEESSSNENTSIEESSSKESSTPVEDENAKYYKLPDWQKDEVNISLGADFLDVAVKRAFMTGEEYTLAYTLSKIPSVPELERVVSSNEEVLTVEIVGTGQIKAVAKHAGKAMIRLYDSNGIIRYCNVITVEDKIELEDMEEYLVYEAEYWVNVMGWVDQYNLTFLDGGRYILSGMFSNSPFETVNGTYEYVGESITGKEYIYKFTDNDIKALGFTGFDISMTGTFMYLQEEMGTADIMLPNDKKEEILKDEK